MHTQLTTLLLAALLASAAHAGPLDPPPGPVAPSGPTLLDIHDNDLLADVVDDIDQRAQEHTLFETRIDVLSLPGDADNAHVIDTMGSYYLSDDVVVDDPLMSGILITAQHVTLDLNGKRVLHTNPALSGPVFSFGVHTPASASALLNIVVRNGTVSNFTNGQVRLYAELGRIENVTATGGEQSALSIFSGESSMFIGCRVDDAADGNYAFITSTSTYGAVVADCHARLTGIGFDVGDGAAIRDSTALAMQGAYGFFVESASVLRRCAARDGAGSGFYALFDEATIFTDCAAVNNAAAGFQLERSLATSCLAKGSGSDGYFMRFRNYLYNCTAIDSDDSGFEMVFEGNRVENCHAETVSGIPANEGFLAASGASGCMVVRNTAVNAFGHFVNASPGTTLFAPHWFDITLAGPWDNLAQ